MVGSAARPAAACRSERGGLRGEAAHKFGGRGG